MVHLFYSVELLRTFWMISSNYGGDVSIYGIWGCHQITCGDKWTGRPSVKSRKLSFICLFVSTADTHVCVCWKETTHFQLSCFLLEKPAPERNNDHGFLDKWWYWVTFTSISIHYHLIMLSFWPWKVIIWHWQCCLYLSFTFPVPSSSIKFNNHFVYDARLDLRSLDGWGYEECFWSFTTALLMIGRKIVVVEQI